MSQTTIPTSEWLAKFEQIKHLLNPVMSFQELFEKEEIFDLKLHILDMGEVHFPTGQILARDPLSYLTKDEQPYYQKVPTGTFKLETLVVEVEKEHYRYMASRVRFNDKKVVRYENALEGTEELHDNFIEGDFFGYCVDAGLATIVDVKTRDAYVDFCEKWEQENIDADGDMPNIYDNFFAAEFAKNQKQNPQFQREDGDWINFKIPNTNLSIPMIQSGWGDGDYPVYFGFDENNQICEVVLEFIPPVNADDKEDK